MLNRRRPLTRPLRPITFPPSVLRPLVDRLLPVTLLPHPSVWTAVIKMIVLGPKLVTWYPTLKNPLVLRLVLKLVLATAQLVTPRVVPAVWIEP